MKHRHHIVPKHDGGTDDEINLTPPVSVRMHAMFHYDRWRALGQTADRIAWLMLLGQRSKAAILAFEKARADHKIFMTGRKQSAETIEKRSAALIGKRYKRIAPAWNKGLKSSKPVSADERKRRSESMKAIRAAQKADGNLPSICQKGKTAWNKGRKRWREVTPELIAKISEGNKRAWARRKAETKAWP